MKSRIKWSQLRSLKRSYYLYGGILFGFILWMLFVDTHSWIIHSELNKEIDQLEREKKALKEYGSSSSGASIGDIIGAALDKDNKKNKKKLDNEEK